MSIQDTIDLKVATVGRPTISLELASQTGFSVAEIDGEYRKWEGNDADSTETFTSTQITTATTSYNTKVSEFAMDVLRLVRDELLTETDWWASSDLTMTTEQTAYRQALRDLPANSASVEIDADNNMTGVTFPTKP